MVTTTQPDTDFEVAWGWTWDGPNVVAGVERVTTTSTRKATTTVRTSVAAANGEPTTSVRIVAVTAV